MIAHPDGVLTVDSSYTRPGMAAVHIVIHQGRAAVIDAGTNDAVPRILGVLIAAGIEPKCVDWVILTHTHLEHAGGTGSLMCAFPNAKLLIHPQEKRHMLNPAQLWQTAVEVYGEAQTFARYGCPVPVAAERIVVTFDGMVIDLQGRRFTILHTPGHTRGHQCIWDESARAFFTGDAFGSSYRVLDVNGRSSVLPCVAPTQFDHVSMHESIDRLLDFGPSAMYLSHFGRIVDVSRMGQDLHRLISAHTAMARAARGEGVARHLEILTGLEQIVSEEAERQGWLLPMPEVLQLLGKDMNVNAQGLGVWLDEQCEPERLLA